MRIDPRLLTPLACNSLHHPFIDLVELRSHAAYEACLTKNPSQVVRTYTAQNGHITIPLRDPGRRWFADQKTCSAGLRLEVNTVAKRPTRQQLREDRSAHQMRARAYRGG